VRGNFWAEVYFGNLGFESHPLGQTLQYQQMGERRFIEQKQQEVFEYIGSHPHEFTERSLQRSLSFWIAPFWASGWH